MTCLAHEAFVVCDERHAVTICLVSKATLPGLSSCTGYIVCFVNWSRIM